MSESNQDGGPAFATDPSYYADASLGLSLRDYFAAKALTSVSLGIIVQAEGDTTYETLANGAYRLADAMLKARKP